VVWQLAIGITCHRGGDLRGGDFASAVRHNEAAGVSKRRTAERSRGEKGEACGDHDSKGRPAGIGKWEVSAG
jgi:hypothetical protein